MRGEIQRSGIGMANRFPAGFLSFDGGDAGCIARDRRAVPLRGKQRLTINSIRGYWYEIWAS